VFWIGTAIIVVAGALLVSGTRKYFTVQRVLFVVPVAFLTFIEVLLVVWGTVMVSAVLFPVLRKSFYASSPARNFKIAGIPVMPVAGAVSTVFFALAFWLLWKDPNAAGPLIKPSKMPVEAWITLGAIVVGTAWYFGAMPYRKRQGLDISLAFQQIPIE